MLLGDLKDGGGVYLKEMTHTSRMPTVVAVCAILHNICEIYGDEFNHEWLEDLEEIAINRTVEETEDEVATSAERIRKVLHSTSMSKTISCSVQLIIYI